MKNQTISLVAANPRLRSFAFWRNLRPVAAKTATEAPRQRISRDEISSLFSIELSNSFNAFDTRLRRAV